MEADMAHTSLNIFLLDSPLHFNILLPIFPAATTATISIFSKPKTMKLLIKSSKLFQEVAVKMLLSSAPTALAVPPLLII